MSGAVRRITLVMTALFAAAMHADTRAAGPSDQELRLDLFRVISLEGLACGGIKDFKRENESDYRVHCKNGEDYLVEVTDQKEVRVLDPQTSKPAGVWLTPLHHVRNLLFSVLSLGGHDCAGVKEVERRGSADHSITCRDGRRYRVDVTDAGKLRVTRE